MKKILVLTAALATFQATTFAQVDSLMSMLDDPNAAKHETVDYTFKATRIINGMSVENLGAGNLDFRVCHRFGQVNQGFENFFGIDNATTKLSLDYGITKNIMVGIGHAVMNKENDGFVKIKILSQKQEGMPITLSYAGVASVMTTDAPTLPSGDTWKFSNRLTFTNQLLIARKFNSNLSLQLMPTLVHYNLVDSSSSSNNVVALGMGGRYKFTKRVAITAEYYLRLTNTDLPQIGSGAKTHNSLSIGFDIETGGHVFQVMITNANSLTERNFIGQTTDKWTDGLHLGFNISRVFAIVKPKELKKDADTKW